MTWAPVETHEPLPPKPPQGRRRVDAQGDEFLELGRHAGFDVTLEGEAAVAPTPAPTAAEPGLMTMKAALLDIGAPQMPGLTPERELLELLNHAAEVEHGLMAQYLYAMYSSRHVGIQGILKGIAIEEMGHLITVQNLLVAGGERPYLGRYDWSDSTFQPFPFQLEPISQQALAKFTVCEMPEAGSKDIDPAQRHLLPEIAEQAQKSAGVNPMRIGLLYIKVYWLLRRDDQPLADPEQEPWHGFPVKEFATSEHAGRHVSEAFFKRAATQQAMPDEWSANQANVLVRAIDGRATALAAVSDISAQGEGFGQTPQGHFDQFVEAYRLAKGQTGLARPVPTDPWYGADDSPGRDPINKITSPDGENFARLADQLYELVLLSISLYYLLPPGIDPALRAGTARVALLLMNDCVAKVGRALVDIERAPNPQTPATVSHLCFTRPAETEETPQAVRARLLTVIDEAVAMAGRIAGTTAVPVRIPTALSIRDRLRADARPLFERIPR